MTTKASSDAHIDALRFSVGRLRQIAGPLGEADLTRRAYPTEWNIARVHV